MNSVGSSDSKSISDIFLQVLRKLDQMDESLPFKCIAESGNNNIVDVSTPPMDLSEVEKRLISNSYNEPWKFVRDVWMLFENAWFFNKKTSKMYQYCSKVAEVFENEMKGIMRSLGYCCGRWYRFDPPTLKCSGKESCSIQKNSKYYSYNKEFNLCAICFSSSTDLHLLTNDQQQLNKENFVETKNDSFEDEPFVECIKCGKKVHEICALYLKCLEKKPFVCEECDLCARNRRKKLHDEFSAKRLPTTKLSQHIQDRVDTFLKTKHLRAGSVTVRVIASSKKCTYVKNTTKLRFTHVDKFPEKFPYTAKTVFVFYEIDSLDVAIFALHVQEYDEACPQPNCRRVYISYLDSVNFFRPRELRSHLYFEILLGYIDYIKKLGYQAVHVWACPPPDGDDYLFHRHPESQKSPDHIRLEEWYKKLLRKGMADGIILSTNSDIIRDSYSGTSRALITRIPYFENDFWSNMLEDTLKNLPETENLNALDEHLTGKFRSIREEAKEIFFVFQLHSYDMIQQLLPIEDPDPLFKCDFMDDRETFLIMCQEKNYEFSTVRRAKFTSLVLLHELHSHEYEKSSSCTCNSCQKNVFVGYHCKVCDDYDLCARCWRQLKHEHDMEYFISEFAHSSPADTIKPAEPESRIESDTEKLTHARLCKDRDCNYDGCTRIKRLITHFTVCSNKMKNSCNLCKDLLTMCWHHAKYCVIKNCVVPTCERIKEKLAKT